MAILRDMGKRGATLNMIDPRKLRVMPDLNARDMSSEATREHVASIAASIEAQGFLGSHPLEVFSEGENIFVAAGHCRLAAVMSLIERGVQIEAVPCLSEARGTDLAQRWLNQVVSNSGQRLNLAEEGKVYRKLSAMGWATARIAKEAGKSEVHIRRALDFTAAPEEAHKLVSEGRISSTLAAETIREEGPVKGVEKLTAAVKRAASEGRARATKKHVEPRAPKPKKAETAPERIATLADQDTACVALVKRLAELSDPFSDFKTDAEANRAFSDFIHEARAIFAPAMSQAAE